jgi:hypothetical protein
MQGKKVFILLIILGLAMIAIALYIFGPGTISRALGFGPGTITFADLRILSAGAESYREGYNPDVENPRDPFGRKFNLPKVWHLLFLTKLTQADTNWLGITIGLLFFIGLLLFPHDLSIAGAILLAILSFSPPVMLGIERGNVELVIFFLCSLCAVTVEKFPILASGILTLAAILKIFPIAGLTAFISKPKKQFAKISGLSILGFAIYVGLTLDNFKRIFANTEKGVSLAYGMQVVALWALDITGSRIWMAITSIVASITAVGILYFALLISAKYKAFPIELPRNIDTFRLGASIYILSFFLGNNWDYRLIFILFTVPQIMNWLENPFLEIRRPALITLGAIIFSMEHLFISALIPNFPSLTLVLDEIANWTLFGMLIFLLFVSAPAWIKTIIRKSTRIASN